MPKLIEKTIIQYKWCEDCSCDFFESYKSSEKSSVLRIAYQKISSDQYISFRAESVTKSDCPRCRAKAQNAPAQ